MKRIFNLIFISLCLVCSHSSIGCTIFASSSKNVVLAGNNEDMCTTNTLIHILPPTEGKYGRIFWGFKGDSNYQGGMNEHGLFFDGAGTPRTEMTDWNLPEFDGRFIFETVLEKCKTVDEAIDFVSNYSMPYLQFSHILVADATSDAVIFEWGKNRMNFVKKRDDSFLIATNFNITETANPEEECHRYSIAKKMLNEAEPSVELFEEILSITHAEGKFPTVYSNICDLKNGKVYLYNFHNFIFRKEIDLKTEFEKGDRKYYIRSFFPVSNSELIFRLRNDCIEEFEDLPQHKVTFRVNLQKPLKGRKIFIQGSAKVLGDWGEPGIELEMISERTMEKTISFKKDILFDYVIADEIGKYVPLNSKLSQIKEQVLEVKSDTIITVNVYEWKVKSQ